MPIDADAAGAQAALMCLREMTLAAVIWGVLVVNLMSGERP